MAIFAAENSIEQGQPQRARQAAPDSDQPDGEKSLTFHASLKFGNKSKPAAEPDDVAKQHSFYTADKRSTRVYYSDYQQKSEVMRAGPGKITTKLDDRQTVGAMLDLAQTRGWDTVKLRGSEDFKREAWVQAQQRGIETEGYQPKATDRQEAERRKAAASPVQAPQKTQRTVSRPTAPAPGASTQQRPRQEKAASVWNGVEAAGTQARASDAMRQGAPQPKSAAAVAV